MTPEAPCFATPVDAGPWGEPLIAARAVSIQLNGRRILEDVDVSVSPGEIVTLIGPNGAGKSTLAKLLLGLLPLQSGTIEKRHGLRVGYVPQRLAVDAALPLAVERFLGITGRVSRDRLTAAVSDTGIAALLRHDLQTLSGGELQRVMLARALARDPDLLILDEPTQGVDIAGEADLYRVIGRVRSQRGIGVLLVSHDLHLVFGQTDRVLCLNRRVCCTGTPDAIRDHPEYARLFGPETTAQLAAYRHRHGA